MLITLPLPSSDLHAHAKGNSHWRKSKATKAARQLACGLGLQARGRGAKCRSIVRAHYQFFVPDLKVRDTTNMLSSMKSAIDGLVDAGVIYRDDWQWLRLGKVDVSLCRENPRVEITITGERE